MSNIAVILIGLAFLLAAAAIVTAVIVRQIHVNKYLKKRREQNNDLNALLRLATKKDK